MFWERVNPTTLSKLDYLLPYNTDIYYDTNNNYIKGALATILTKKIICFGNW